MVYVISGPARSGTSLMMQACRAGGMEIAFSRKREDMLTSFFHEANPNGFFELDFNDYSNPNFLEIYSDKVVKVFPYGLSQIPIQDCSIVFMNRDKRERERSIEKHLGKSMIPIWTREEKIDFPNIKHVNYHEVLLNPVSIFSSFNWPLNSVKASSVVNLALYRERICQ